MWRKPSNPFSLCLSDDSDPSFFPLLRLLLLGRKLLSYMLRHLRRPKASSSDDPVRHSVLAICCHLHTLQSQPFRSALPWCVCLSLSTCRTALVVFPYRTLLCVSLQRAVLIVVCPAGRHLQLGQVQSGGCCGSMPCSCAEVGGGCSGIVYA